MGSHEFVRIDAEGCALRIPGAHSDTPNMNIGALMIRIGFLGFLIPTIVTIVQ